MGAATNVNWREWLRARDEERVRLGRLERLKGRESAYVRARSVVEQRLALRPVSVPAAEPKKRLTSAERNQRRRDLARTLERLEGRLIVHKRDGHPVVLVDHSDRDSIG